MEIHVTGRHLEVTDALREYAIEKASKLPRYFDRVQQIEILLDRPNNQQYEVEFIVHVEHHDNFVARTPGTDLYGCIDETTDKLERQLTDHKEKLRDRKRVPRGS